MLTLVTQEQVSNIIATSKPGKNTKFIKASHSLWTRFKNYQTNPPFAWTDNNKIVAIIFATMSKRTKYVNLYEICTVEGEEKKGYATKIWSAYINNAYRSGMQRIKLSCTPSSITWHLRNGLIFWGVDKQGSLRSDQPLMQTIEEQNNFREQAVFDPGIALPDEVTRKRLKSEDLETIKLSKRKIQLCLESIQTVGKYWLRKYL